MKSENQSSKKTKMQAKQQTTSSKKVSTLDEFIVSLLGEVEGLNDNTISQIGKLFSANVTTMIKLSTTTKKVKKVKDPDAPKRGKSSYILFCADLRSKVIKENPVFSTTDVMKELGSKWRSISDKDKSKYTKLSEKDKQRYETELKKYNDKHPELENKKPKSTRKRSGYLVFCQETRPKVKADQSELTSQEVTKELGKRWKSLSTDEQKVYNDKV